MALPTALLIAVERLKQDENTLFRHYSQVHPPAVNIPLIDSAIQQVALDRIAFAREFVESAIAMLAGTPIVMDFRNATSRAYYAVHHSLRAVLLYDLKADQYGHLDAIKQFLKQMRSNPSLNAKATAANVNEAALLEILHSRHLADYHCYRSAQPHEQPVDFSMVAPQATNFAEDVVAKLDEYLQDRIAGVY